MKTDMKTFVFGGFLQVPVTVTVRAGNAIAANDLAHEAVAEISLLEEDDELEWESGESASYETSSVEDFTINMIEERDE